MAPELPARLLSDRNPPLPQRAASSFGHQGTRRSGVMLLNDIAVTFGDLDNPVAFHVAEGLDSFGSRPLHRNLVNAVGRPQTEMLPQRVLTAVSITQDNFAHLRLP